MLLLSTDLHQKLCTSACAPVTVKNLSKVTIPEVTLVALTSAVLDFRFTAMHVFVGK